MASFQPSKEMRYNEIINEDQDEPHERPQPRKSSWRPWHVAACILLASLSCLVGFFAGKLTGSRGLRNHAFSPISHIPELPVTFQPDPRYGGPSSSESDIAWSSLSPPGDGFVVIKNPSDFNLPLGKQTSQGSLYDVSVFHQLHCLTKIREHASLLGYALQRNDTAGFNKIINPQAGHIDHCFDYLRQSIMCAGDLTLEWPKDGPHGERSVVDGWGIPHLCKNWDAVLSFVKSKSVPY